LPEIEHCMFIVLSTRRLRLDAWIIRLNTRTRANEQLINQALKTHQNPT